MHARINRMASLSLLALASTASAQAPPDAGAPPVDATAPPPEQPASPAATPSPAAPSWTAPFARALELLHPEVAAIIDFAAGYYSDVTLRSTDDPGDTGANLQKLELAFQAGVDRYLRAEVFVGIANLGSIQVEEAFLTAPLPASLQLRAGVLRARFGRQNTQHLHLLDFTRRPEMNALFLGPDGLHPPGLELSWLAPLPLRLRLTAAAFSVAGPTDVAAPLASFGGGTRRDFTYLGNLTASAPLGAHAALTVGLSFATGIAAKLSAAGQIDLSFSRRSYLFGADAGVEWKGAGAARTPVGVAWTTEYYFRGMPDGGPTAPRILDGALYSQLVLQVARWSFGVRGEVDGIPASTWDARQYAGSGSITIAASAFFRIRAFAEARYLADSSATPTFLTQAASLPVGFTYNAFLQLEAAIGAHGARPH